MDAIDTETLKSLETWIPDLPPGEAGGGHAHHTDAGPASHRWRYVGLAIACGLSALLGGSVVALLQ